MRGPIFHCCQRRGALLLRGRGRGTAEIVLFTSFVWLRLIELWSCRCNSDWPLIDLSSDGQRQHDWWSLTRISDRRRVIPVMSFFWTPGVQFLLQKQPAKLVLLVFHLCNGPLAFFQICQCTLSTVNLKVEFWISQHFAKMKWQHVQTFRKLILLLFSLQPSNLKSERIWMSQSEHI